ncbi:helix-hairpin-helix domain-containing protein [Salmonirosea aquatica]|uniref:Helix-hairpin-helix domain-containing protein n=1 Tax=Salmonirosea aquatica TaxID=2654236 RepID=A0A7C9BM53_9BACT|nr:helix-hairpin-helix domain-containing protein [Cytophagaceae bacterium SJW1-29]
MLRKILYKIQDFLGISPKESRGALVLIILSFGLIWTPTVFKWWVLPLFQSDTVPFTIEQLDSTAALIPKSGSSSNTDRNFSENEVPYSRDDEKSAPPTRFFAFDPNTASTAELQELGVPRFLAQRIQKYREKGGKFRKNEDLKKIYDFPPALYNQLEGYIVLPGSGPKFAESETRSDEGTPTPTLREFKTFTRPVPTAFDINTADTTQLAELRGIGSKLSARIVKFRDALGGFYSTEQYPEIFGLDSLALSELRRYARVQSPPTKIPINTATVQELNRHPYFRNRKLNEVIVRYREQHGPFASAEAMKEIRILDEATLRKMVPYLAF